MAKKTYRTYHLKGLALHLIDEHYHPIDVYFNAGAQIDSTAKFTTGDEKVQKAIEACSGFGRDFYIESVREDAPVVNESENVVEEETVTEGLQEVEVADKAEAIEWLKEHHAEKGYTAAKLRTKSAFEEACAECGVVFKITD
jgi:hypothetical protein